MKPSARIWETYLLLFYREVHIEITSLIPRNTRVGSEGVAEVSMRSVYFEVRTYFLGAGLVVFRPIERSLMITVWAVLSSCKGIFELEKSKLLAGMDLFVCQM